MALMCTIVVSPNWCVIAIPRAPPRAEAWILTCVTTRAAFDTRAPARGGCWAIQIPAHNRRAQGRRTHTRAPGPCCFTEKPKSAHRCCAVNPAAPRPRIAMLRSSQPGPATIPFRAVPSAWRRCACRAPAASCFCGHSLYDPSSQCQYVLFIHINLITIKVCFTSLLLSMPKSALHCMQYAMYPYITHPHTYPYAFIGPC